MTKPPPWLLKACEARGISRASLAGLDCSAVSALLAATPRRQADEDKPLSLEELGELIRIKEQGR